MRWLPSLLSDAMATDVCGAVYRDGRLLLETEVAGTFFSSDAAYAAQYITFGTTLELRRDPGNVFDGNAVAVHVHGLHLGWVPQKENHDIARLMDAGCKPVCRVHGIRWVGHTLRVTVRISLPEG